MRVMSTNDAPAHPPSLSRGFYYAGGVLLGMGAGTWLPRVAGQAVGLVAWALLLAGLFAMVTAIIMQMRPGP